MRSRRKMRRRVYRRVYRRCGEGEPLRKGSLARAAKSLLMGALMGRPRCQSACSGAAMGSGSGSEREGEAEGGMGKGLGAGGGYFVQAAWETPQEGEEDASFSAKWLKTYSAFLVGQRRPKHRTKGTPHACISTTAYTHTQYTHAYSTAPFLWASARPKHRTRGTHTVHTQIQ